MNQAPCPSAVEWGSFRKGSLPPPLQAKLQEHLANCRECRAAHGGVKTHVGIHEEAPEKPAFPFLGPPVERDEIGRLGPYRVIRLLGRGGMGAVFLAEDPSLARKVALKVMLPETEDQDGSTKRFIREARAMAAIKDPHLVTVYQAGLERGAPYLAMELLDGETLEDRIRREKLEIRDILRIGREIARGLSAIHKNWLIHRDIKPSNIWLEAPQGRVKILDFGLARTVGGTKVTLSGTVVGTPAFMSPEQARGETLDARSDLFSLGCVLYNMCTGVEPFQGTSIMAQLTALAVDDPKPAHEVNPRIPVALSNYIAKLLSKSRDDRPASADEVVAGLQSLVKAPAKPAPPPEKAKKKSPVQLYVAVASSSVALLLLIILLWPKSTPEPEPAPKKPSSPPVVHKEPDIPVDRQMTDDPARSRASEDPAAPDFAKSPLAMEISETPRDLDDIEFKEPIGIVKPRLPERVFLTDFPEGDMDLLWFAPETGKRGRPDPNAPPDVFRMMSADLRPSPHGIGMHPNRRGAAFIVYKLDRRCRRFVTRVTQNDGPPPAESAFTFKVYGDGKLLWKSKPVKSRKDAQECNISVEGVDVLKLEVSCEGEGRAAHALWFEPAIER